jgi:hypothetical protein
MSGRTIGNFILMTVICIVLFWVFMALRPANAIQLHCGSSWTICDIRARNHYWTNRSTTPHRYCDALCQAKCDATSRNPQACYVKWQKINADGRGRMCESANRAGQKVTGC